MTATFTIGGTTATFNERIVGTNQDSGDLEKLTLGFTILTDDTQWLNMLALVTTKYHVHVPLDPAAAIIVDIIRGAGPGTLVVPRLGTATAIMTAAKRGTYLVHTRSQGSLEFLITTAWS